MRNALEGSGWQRKRLTSLSRHGERLGDWRLGAMPMVFAVCQAAGAEPVHQSDSGRWCRRVLAAASRLPFQKQ